MEVVLITGLDGSGKSTVFKKLIESQLEGRDVVLVPHIRIDSDVSGDELILKTAIFLNSLSKRADESKSIQLKSVALFGAMLLFGEILEIKSKNTNLIYCERHPLIDTLVYAQFYAKKLAPDKRNIAELKALDLEFKEELQFLCSLIPNGILNKESGLAESILDVIYEWLYFNKRNDFASIKHLF